jgi:hypothetical protein
VTAVGLGYHTTVGGGLHAMRTERFMLTRIMYLLAYVVSYVEFENMAQFRYLATTITKQNLIQKEIKRR